MKKTATNATITVRGTEVAVIQREGQDYISLTDMLKAKDGDFFISDWLRNRNAIEFLGIWESVYNPRFNSGEFAIILKTAVKRCPEQERRAIEEELEGREEPRAAGYGGTAKARRPAD